MTKPPLRQLGLLAAALLLAGCSALGGSGGSAPVASGGASTPGPVATGAESVGIDPANPPAAIATAEAPIQQRGLDSVKVELVSLTKRDKLLYGVFRITPQGDWEGDYDLYDMGFNWAPSLIDPAGLKKYLAVALLTTSTVGPQVKPGQSMYIYSAWAYPDGVAQVDIQSLDEVPIMEGVAVP